MAVTITDVAKVAGVSPRTVSNVVNNFVHVKPETRARVEAAIMQMGYVPNIAARRLRQGKTGIIGYAVPELSQPYFAEVSELLEEAARERGYTVIASQTGGDSSRERAVLKNFTSHLVDGLIFSPMDMTAADLSAQALGVPLVLIGEQIDHPEFVSFAIANEKAVREAVGHLFASGRKRIAALGAYRSERYRSSQQRMQGYRLGLADAGIEFDENLVIYTDRFSREAGYEGVRRALEAGVEFDALMCFTDVLAFGAIRALADHGLRVPHDVAIVGMDSVRDTEFSVPSVSSIAPDKRAIVESALDALGRAIDGEPDAASRVDISYELKIRESSAARKD